MQPMINEPMINELDRVALAHPLPEHELVSGDVGTVVAVHEGGKGYTVEFLSLEGKTIAIVAVRAAAVRPVRPREITHSREMV
jgi:hypothetical protein